MTRIAERNGQRSRLPLTRVSLAALLCVTGCASTGEKSATPWRVEPIARVQESAAASHGYYLLGRYHDGMRAWGRAVDAYGKAVVVDPDNVEAHNALGVALARLGRHDEAVAALNAGLAIDPGRAHLHNNLGYVHLLTNRLASAIAAFKAAVKLEPTNATAFANLRHAVHQRELAQSASDASPTASASARAQTIAAAPASAQPLVAASGAPHDRVQAATRPSARVFALPAPAAAPPVELPTASKTLDPRHALVPSSTAAELQRVAFAPAAMPPADRVSLERLEISNGNGVAGAAANTRRHLSASMPIGSIRLTNQRPFTQKRTTIQYRDGFDRQARQIAQMLANPVPPAIEAGHGFAGQVRVILGHDRNAETCDAKRCETVAQAPAVR